MKMAKGQESEASRKIFVARLALATTEDDLDQYFKKYGKVLGVRIVRDYQTHISKRFG